MQWLACSETLDMSKAVTMQAPRPDKPGMTQRLQERDICIKKRHPGIHAAKHKWPGNSARKVVSGAGARQTPVDVSNRQTLQRMGVATRAPGMFQLAGVGVELHAVRHGTHLAPAEQDF